MEKILFSTAGLVGKIECDSATIERIKIDKFTEHYLPDFRHLEGDDLESDFSVLQRDISQKADIRYPIAFLHPSVDHRSYVVTAEYIAERMRQERFGVFAFNSASAEKNNKGVIFYGHASNLGKTTFARALSEEAGFNLFSDEKTLIDLERRMLVSGSRSIPLRKEVWKNKYPSEGEYKNITVEPGSEAKIELMITPHYDHGLSKPIITKLTELDLLWNMAGAIARRIRGVTRFIDDFTYQLQSIDTEDLTKKRMSLLRSFSKDVRGYYFQGDSKQLVDFVLDETGSI